MSATIPPLADPRWTQIFKLQKTYTFEFLATNMVFTRLNIDVRRDSSEVNIKRVASELWEIFAKNSHNPKVQNDVKKIFG